MKKSIFRISTLVLILVFIFTLASCSDNPKKSEQKPTEEQEIQKSQSETEKDKTSLLTGNEGPTNVPEGKDCLHETMKSKTFATDGCGHHINYEECSDCGYKHVFDYDYFGIEDKSSTLGYEEKDARCKICGISLTKELVSSNYENCYAVEVYKITLKNADKVVITDLFDIEEGTLHQNTEYRENVDLTQYGACSGTISGDYCLDCNKFGYITLYDSCLDFGHGIYKCEVCNLEYGNYFYKFLEIVYEPCICYYLSGNDLKINGQSISESYYYFFYDNHDFVNEYTLLDDTCSDGVKITSKCVDEGCDNVCEYISNYHQLQYRYVELQYADDSTYLGNLALDYCLACGDVTQVYMSLFSETEEQEDVLIDGLIYKYNIQRELYFYSKEISDAVAHIYWRVNEKNECHIKLVINYKIGNNSQVLEKEYSLSLSNYEEYYK